jgi:zinc transport system substrate-binding protein
MAPRVRSGQMITRLVLILVCSVTLAGCGSDSARDDAPGSRHARSVVAAFYPLAFLAERIGGETVEVRNLTPAGAEPHDVELSARDVETLRDADYVLYLGGDFQPAVEDAVDDADGRTVDVLSGLELLKGKHGHETDPHIWLDPIRFAEAARQVGAALDRPEPAAALSRELRDLDLEFKRGLRRCKRREIVTSHAAFGYLAQRYGLEQIPVTGISPEAEPSARDLERVVSEVRRRGATTVFFETLVSPRVAETVAREAGARTAELNPIEGLSEDELAAGENYFSVMRANLAALRRALGCR